ncbi:MAG TPA: hypothetical protein VGB92_18480 [Longimicrobium sp.]
MFRSRASRSNTCSVTSTADTSLRSTSASAESAASVGSSAGDGTRNDIRSRCPSSTTELATNPPAPRVISATRGASESGWCADSSSSARLSSSRSPCGACRGESPGALAGTRSGTGGGGGTWLLHPSVERRMATAARLQRQQGIVRRIGWTPRVRSGRSGG